MAETVIVSGARTPFGKMGGALASLSAMDLGGHVLKAAMTRAGMESNQLDEVVMGHVLQGGQGQLPSRQAARAADIPWDVKTETINKVCASGMRSVTLADQIIRSGDGKRIAAGGMESMSQAPHFLPSLRFGQKMGDAKLVDGMVHDGLTCAFEGVHMGVYGNRNAFEFNISREAQDEWAARSHERAQQATESGRFQDEIAAVTVPQKRGDDVVIDRDEAIRENVSAETLAQLPPAFDKDGTITAGNAPGVNDGASALIIMEREAARADNLEPLATIVGHTAIAVETERFPQTPGLIIDKLLQKTGYRRGDIDLFEMNEAFAVVALLGEQLSGVDADKINVNGGAVALGHPIGASGNRILLTLAHELRRRGGGLGIAAICSGGGQGDAVLLQV
ncbi:acetyl-CoA C-acetyltransferase [Natribacillus halophilus]|uniref:acetyl-CoA C-acetyltransferase n=1 Tax=Natribacillus halophilus TaxID=549003 RepID=A0A1G8KVV3_9BACI|nr:acetyl-CoA C-acetyltransferase [Natribacillus halophilus]SDI47516.1 acetyl-CoA C-acetyltransferase [Natribacillus halophilus]